MKKWSKIREAPNFFCLFWPLLSTGRVLQQMQGVHVMQIQVFSAAKDLRKDIESRSSVMTISEVKLIGYDILHFWGVSERTMHFSQKSKNRFGMDIDGLCIINSGFFCNSSFTVSLKFGFESILYNYNHSTYIFSSTMLLVFRLMRQIRIVTRSLRPYHGNHA